MKKILIFIFILLISSSVFAGQITMAPTIIQSNDCSFLTWYGTLCLDTDDGKLYKWDGETQVEIATALGFLIADPGAAGGVLGSDGTDWTRITFLTGITVDLGDAVANQIVTMTNAGVLQVGDNAVAPGNISGATYSSDGSVTDVELRYINTLTSNAQDQLDAKAPIDNPTFTTGINVIGTITSSATNDPFIKLDEADGTDWWIGINDAANSLEFRNSATVGTDVKMELTEDGLLKVPGIKATEVLCTADDTLTAVEVSRTILNSYGRGVAAITTLPTATAGMTFTAIVGTQHDSAWQILRGGTDTIVWNGVAGKTYFQETNQAVGSRVSCMTFKTGASAWTWACDSAWGTWTTD